MLKLYENIDYLEIRLISSSIKELLSGIVVNSPTYYIGDFSIQLRDTYKDWMYYIYDVFYRDTDILNREIKIASINWIKNTNLSKHWVYLTFPWLPFKNYWWVIVYHLLDTLWYKYQVYKFQVYRLDFCMDFEKLSVKNMTWSLLTEKLNFNNFPIRFDPKTKKPTWFALPFAEDTLRVYNKKLDINDRETFNDIPWYKEYLKNDNVITRVEIQLNRNKFKNKFVYDLDSLYEYWKNSLYKKLNKYFSQEYITKNIVFEKDINYLEQTQKKEYEFSKKMFLAYKQKLIANPYANKFLKNQIKDLEQQIYPWKQKIKEVFI